MFGLFKKKKEQEQRHFMCLILNQGLVESYKHPEKNIDREAIIEQLEEIYADDQFLMDRLKHRIEICEKAYGRG